VTWLSASPPPPPPEVAEPRALATLVRLNCFCSMTMDDGRRTVLMLMLALDGVRDALKFLQAGELVSGGEGGADVGPLGAIGAVLFGLTPESQRYFDYHHSDKDTLDKVNPRELELGAISMATLAWFISEKGL
jgi:hypothetical protein